MGRYVDVARYIVAVVVVIALPPAVLIWYAIHPFAKVWRRVGPVATYAILAVPYAAVIAALVTVRDRLVGRDLGTSLPLILLGLVCMAAAVMVRRGRKKLLTQKVLMGVPELSSESRGDLLQTGIYARVRNPRYVEVFLGTLGDALIANYLGAYIFVALLVPGLYAVVLLEERELRERFGAEYEDYCRRVPRFIPRRRQPTAAS